FTPTMMGRHMVKWSAVNASVAAYEKDFETRDFFQFQPVTLTEAKKFLKIKNNNDDEELSDFIDTAVDLAEEYCHRVFGRRTITEIHNGGTAIIFYRQPVALSITSVSEDGITLDPSKYINDAQGFSVIRDDYYNFSTNLPGNIVITYVAGYNNVPKGAVHGIKLLLKHIWETQRGSTMINNRNADDYDPRVTYTYPRRVEQALQKYRLISVS